MKLSKTKPLACEQGALFDANSLLKNRVTIKVN